MLEELEMNRHIITEHINNSQLSILNYQLIILGHRLIKELRSVATVATEPTVLQ
jgi:hypothetical protein